MHRFIYSIVLKLKNQNIKSLINFFLFFRNVDFMNLLSYDYYTSYDPETGHHSPLSAPNGISAFDDAKKLNVEWTVNYYLEKGAPRNKLVVGIPTYGRSYTLTDKCKFLFLVMCN